MPKIIAQTTEVVTGITLQLTNDEATHLSYALGGYIDLIKKHTHNGSRSWPFIERLRDQLDDARGSGCTMGPRVNK